MNQFEITIKAHLDKVALSDTAFAEKYRQKSQDEENSIEKCCGFIISEVQKLNRIAMTDAEVYGMAMHYYDENINFEGSVPQCHVVASVEGLSEEDKAKIRAAAQEEIEREAVEAEKRRLLEEARKQEEMHKKRLEEAKKKKQQLIDKKKEEFGEEGLLFSFDEE